MIIGSILFLSMFLRGKVSFGRSFTLVFLFVCSSVVSTIISNDWHQSLKYLAFYIMFVAPSLLLFYQIFKNPFFFSWFLFGFLSGSLASSIIGMAQSYYAESFPAILINHNFALFNQIDRAYGLTPESSILAGLLLLSLSVLIVLWLRSDSRMWLIDNGLTRSILKSQVIFLYLIVNLVGLMLTRSSSVILLTPIILLGVGHSCRNERGGWYVNRLLSIFIITGVLFVFLNTTWAERLKSGETSGNAVKSSTWTERLKSGDAYGSLVMRGSSMLVAIETTIQYPLFGVGLGQTKKYVTKPITELMGAVMPGLPTKDGVDSFFLHLAVEHGVVVYLVFMVLVASIYRMMFGRNKVMMRTNPFLLLKVVLAYSLVIVATITVGYRGLYHLWMIFPLVLLIKKSELHRINE